jgi:nucleoside-diphosphate-sugar epimerase
MKRVLISGASGQLGRRLAATLCARQDVEVHALTSSVAAASPVLDGLGLSGIVELDDGQEIDRLLARADIVFHCAFARSHAGAALARSLQVASRIFSKACSNGAGAVVNVSSQSVYGAHREGTSSERDPVNPADAYALCKYGAELLLAQIAGAGGLAHTQVRLASLVGDGMDERLVTRLVLDALAGKPLSVQGGTQQFSFMDMADAVAGLASMLDRPPKHWAPVYNLGPQLSNDLLTIARTVARLVHEMRGIDVEVNVVPSSICNNAMLDSSAFFADFDFLPRKGLADTVAGIIARHPS